MEQTLFPARGLTRRDALRLLAGSLAVGAWPGTLSGAETSPEAESPRRTAMGLVTYCCRLRRDKLRRDDPKFDLYEPAAFLEHCRTLGAGGMQIDLGVRDAKYTTALREAAEKHALYIEGIVSLPRDKQDVGRFDAELATAKAAGARAVRTVIMSGRRYEEFDSLEAFRQADARGRRMLELAAPVAEKHKLPLAVENHKDHRNRQRVALLEHIASEYVGACVDTGNSLALLEDPIGTVEALAPWAHSVHLKDQAVRETTDGFLLGDIPLGQGILDLKRIVEILRTKKPGIRFSLELITRDPLKVPCLTDRYWATFPDVPASDLARMMRAVRAGASDKLQQVNTLSPDEQVALEDANVRASLDYARRALGL